MGGESEIVLTEAQQSAIDASLKFLERGKKNVFKIGGYAGTGKTTILKTILAEAKKKGWEGYPCAFTGKATSVLRRKGVWDANTIHKTIYHYDQDENEFVLLDDLQCKFVVIDEGSMVSKSLWNDLRSFGKPIIVVGDPGQLEPVGDDPNLMKHPDIVLEQIHRQAENSSIIRIANQIRKGETLECGTDGDVTVGSKSLFNDEPLWASQILCGFNKTRVKVNKAVRYHLGRKDVLEVGERIICLSNDRRLGVWNGMILTVEEVHPKRSDRVWVVGVVTEDGYKYREFPVWMGSFGRVNRMSFEETKTLRGICIADYAYCVTVHKFQGSEAENILVVDEQCQKWQPKRWRYTALTRASDAVRVIKR